MVDSAMIRPFDHPILVSRPALPPLEEFAERLGEIWQSRMLTNNGPVLQRLTAALARYHGTDNLSVISNGTQALHIGLKALGTTGEVITTPFSFVATSHALVWNGVCPVFVDIEPEFYTLDPARVEAAITPHTTAILAVHVYGHPCELDALAAIARRHGIHLLYDAAHAFGVEVRGKSIARFGDLSAFSFHATKLFHSLEGGMLSCPDPRLKAEVDYLRNFGFANEVDVVRIGTNGKLNEVQALMGELLLPRIPAIISARKLVYERYRERLVGLRGIKMVPVLPSDVSYNYAYLPVEVEAKEFGMTRDGLYETLKRYNVFARRYFYPLIPDLACYQKHQPIDPLTTARHVAERILTLPIYHDLELDDVDRICEIIETIQQHEGV